MKVLLKTRHVLPLMLILLACLLGLVGERLMVAHAANTTFTSCPDQTTLQNTINANPGSTIVFSISSLCTIPLTVSPIVINQSVTLDNQGKQVILDGQNNVQVIQVSGGVTFTLNALTIAHGSAPNGAGGGLDNEGGTVDISNSTFDGNSASSINSGGGGLDNDGGTVDISNSTFTNNSAPNGAGGGLVNQNGTMSISNSTFANNSASGGRVNGGFGGGLLNFDGRVSISNSTFANNSAPNGVGGGLSNFGTMSISNSTFANNSAFVGGGLDNDEGTMSISNSTVDGNSAPNGEGGGLSNFGTMSISNSTIDGNSTGSFGGGGLANDGGVVSIAQSIVANNTASTGANCSGPITDQGYNLSNDMSCGFMMANHSLPNTNPMLGPLQDNGGPTKTMALLPGSPAIDYIPAPSVCTLSSDQRGFPRPDNGESVCDIGAYEFQDPPAPGPGPVPSVPPCQVSTDPAQEPNRDGSSQQDGVRSLTGAGTFCLNQNGRFVTTDISRR